MFELSKDKRNEYFEKIMDSLEEYSYRQKRYNVNFAVALVQHDMEISLEDFIQIKRKTDRYIRLENNLCCIIFDCVDIDSSQKAMKNIKAQLEGSSIDKEIFVRYISSVECENASKIVNSLFDMLEEFKYNDYTNERLSAIG